MDGRLHEGDRLPSERELAETFGVSRPAVREAMRVLEAFGVVVAKRGNSRDAGSTITSIEATNGLGAVLRLHTAVMRIPLSDLVEVRVPLEAAAIRAVIAKVSDVEVDRLEEIVEEMADARDRQAFLEADTLFHVTLAELSGNIALSLLMGALREAIALQMLRALESIDDFDRERRRLVKEHREIVELVRSGDTHAAVDAITSHIRNFYSRVMRRSASLEREHSS